MNIGEQVNEQLVESLEEAMKRAQENIEALQKHPEFSEFLIFRQEMESLTHSLAVAHTLVKKCDHAPSAKAALALVDYIEGAHRFITRVCVESGLTPNDVGFNNDPTDFLEALSDTYHDAEQVLEKEELAKSLAD